MARSLLVKTLPPPCTATFLRAARDKASLSQESRDKIMHPSLSLLDLLRHHHLLRDWWRPMHLLCIPRVYYLASSPKAIAQTTGVPVTGPPCHVPVGPPSAPERKKKKKHELAEIARAGGNLPSPPTLLTVFHPVAPSGTRSIYEVNLCSFFVDGIHSQP